jgi:hypothetical protein
MPLHLFSPLLHTMSNQTVNVKKNDRSKLKNGLHINLLYNWKFQDYSDVHVSCRTQHLNLW